MPEPDGSLRMCIDYRGLNKVTVKNKFPMPRIDDLLDNLSGAKYFSTVDLAAVYHQLKLQSSDVPKTAFNTHFGKFEWRVLPFGLTNAPAVFQPAMNRVFGTHLNKCACVYLDDILIFSRSEEEHFQHLEMVLKLLRDNKLFAKMKKCDFFKPELKYLGHVVSAAGINPAKVQTISDWPTPTSVNEVRQFLGLSNYFHKFIRAYAATASPLSDLLKGLSKRERASPRRQRRVSALDAQYMAANFSARWCPACDVAFALCALKSNRLACRSFTLDAEANGVTRRAQGPHTSGGGGDTPPATYTNSAATELADVSYPAPSADDELSVSSYAIRNFIQRFQSGYNEDQKVSPPEFDYIRLTRIRMSCTGLTRISRSCRNMTTSGRRCLNQYTSTPSQVTGA